MSEPASGVFSVSPWTNITHAPDWGLSKPSLGAGAEPQALNFFTKAVPGLLHPWTNADYNLPNVLGRPSLHFNKKHFKPYTVQLRDLELRSTNPPELYNSPLIEVFRKVLSFTQRHFSHLQINVYQSTFTFLGGYFNVCFLNWFFLRVLNQWIELCTCVSSQNGIEPIPTMAFLDSSVV